MESGIDAFRGTSSNGGQNIWEKYNPKGANFVDADIDVASTNFIFDRFDISSFSHFSREQIQALGNENGIS